MATGAVFSRPSALALLLFLMAETMALGSPTPQGIDEAHCFEAARIPVAEAEETKEEAEQKDDGGKDEANHDFFEEKDAEKKDETSGDRKGKRLAAGWIQDFDIEDFDGWTTETETETDTDEDYLFGSDDEDDDDDKEAEDKEEEETEKENDADDNASNDDEKNGKKRKKIMTPDLNDAIEINPDN